MSDHDKPMTKLSKNMMAKKICDDVWRAVGMENDPAKWRDSILTLFFWKFISDNHHANDNNLASQADPANKSATFQIPPDCDFQSFSNWRGREDIGEQINAALAQIASTNPELEDLFRWIDFKTAMLSEELNPIDNRLGSWIDIFSAVDLRTDDSARQQGDSIGQGDSIAQAFLLLLERFAAASKKEANEFYTPPELTQLMAHLIDPQPGATLYDPACGTGTLLIRTAQQTADAEAADVKTTIFGQDIEVSYWALCRMNLLIHGYDAGLIERGDTLREPRHLLGGTSAQFDVVASHPPFSLNNWGAEEAEREAGGQTTLGYNRFARGIPPKNRGDYAFLLHMVASAREETGKVGVVLPQGVLFRGGAEGDIRRRLVEENLIEAVIGLPSKIFFDTAIPSAVLMLRKGRTTKGILFIDASREYQSAARQNQLREKDIAKIVGVFQQRADIEGYSHLTSPSEIAQNDFDLSISRYVHPQKSTAQTDVDVLQKEIETLEAQLKRIRSQMKKYVNQLER
jgi:type I restriction enzyme M protein